MPYKLSSETVGPQRTPSRLRLTDQRLRAMRAEQARLALLYAGRAERAQATARFAAVAHWTYQYGRCAMRCRVLGERISSLR